MTFLLDANVVLSAHRDDHPKFGLARDWLDATVESGQSFSVPRLVWGSFLRLASDRRIFADPNSIEDLFSYLEAVRGQAGYVEAEPGPRHFEILRELCREGGAAGNLVPDAILGAIAVENACEVVSMDRDFARFDSVRFHLLA